MKNLAWKHDCKPHGIRQWQMSVVYRTITLRCLLSGVNFHLHVNKLAATDFTRKHKSVVGLKGFTEHSSNSFQSASVSVLRKATTRYRSYGSRLRGIRRPYAVINTVLLKKRNTFGKSVPRRFTLYQKEFHGYKAIRIVYYKTVLKFKIIYL